MACMAAICYSVYLDMWYQDIEGFFGVLAKLAKAWRLIALLGVVGVLYGAIYAIMIQSPLYESKASVVVVHNKESIQNQVIVHNYAHFLTSRTVLEAARNASNNVISMDELRRSVRTDVKPDTSMIYLTVGTDNAEVSKSIADGMLASFGDLSKSIYKDYTVRIIDMPDTPTINAHPPAALYAAAGGVVAIGVTAIIYSLFYEVRAGLRTKKQTIALEKSDSK